MIKTEYTLNSHSLKLAVKIISGKNDWNILFLGGYASDMTGKKASFLAELTTKLEGSAVFFDYSGHGKSEGNFIDGTIGSWFNDACIIFEKFCQKKKTIIIGSSMGGWMAMMLAKKYSSQCAGLILLCPAPDFPSKIILPKLNRKEIDIFNKNRQIALTRDIPKDTDIIFTKKLYTESYQHNLLSNNQQIILKCKVRILHGLMDDDVPWQHALLCEKSITSSDKQIILFSDGNHNLSKDDNLVRLKTEILAVIHDFNNDIL